MKSGRSGDNNFGESDISDWVKEKVLEELTSRKYTVCKIDVMAILCRKINKLGLVYTIDFDVTSGEDSDFYGIRNFSSVKGVFDGMEKFKWFPDFFKEIEAEAVLKFGHRVLGIERHIDEKPRNKMNMEMVEKKTVEVLYTVCINCSIQEVTKFLCDKEFISMWSGGSAVFSDNEIVIDNVVIQGMELKSENVVIMNWKFVEWDEFSSVDIVFEPQGKNTRVSVKQRGVPILKEECVRTWWHKRVFTSISSCFGFFFEKVEHV